MGQVVFYFILGPGIFQNIHQFHQLMLGMSLQAGICPGGKGLPLEDQGLLLEVCGLVLEAGVGSWRPGIRF